MVPSVRLEGVRVGSSSTMARRRRASRMEVDYSCICDWMYCGLCGASVPDEGLWCRQNAGAGSIFIGRDIYCRPVGEWDDRLVSGTFYVEKSDYKWKVYEA